MKFEGLSKKKLLKPLHIQKIFVPLYCQNALNDNDYDSYKRDG